MDERPRRALERDPAGGPCELCGRNPIEFAALSPDGRGWNVCRECLAAPWEKVKP